MQDPEKVACYHNDQGLVEIERVQVPNGWLYVTSTRTGLAAQFVRDSDFTRRVAESLERGA